MMTNEINLFALSGERIKGVKLADGSIGNIVYTVDNKKTLSCKLPTGLQTKTEGTYTFILDGDKEVVENLESILNHSFDLWTGIS